MFVTPFCTPPPLFSSPFVSLAASYNMCEGRWIFSIFPFAGPHFYGRHHSADHRVILAGHPDRPGPIGVCDRGYAEFPRTHLPGNPVNREGQGPTRLRLSGLSSDTQVINGAGTVP